MSKQASPQKSQHANLPSTGALIDETSPNHRVHTPKDIYDFSDDDSCDPQAEKQKDKPKTRTAKDFSPLRLEQAIPRRLDWTPPKSVSDDSTFSPESQVQATTFSKDVLQNFVFAQSSVTTTVQKVATKVDGNGEAMKRRRIDLVTVPGNHEGLSLPAVKLDPPKELEKGGSKKRNKSPPKKALTITGLATSHYGEGHHKGRKVAPMLEYLTATQVNADSDSETFSEQQAKKKAAVKKPRSTKKAPAKNRLQSPTSVMKTVDSQELVFGSASQLARDESPTLLRDTLEAIKRSECILSSDPISPPRTQPFSIESTSPSASRGTSRFVKRKNLWSAAGRDEDNALLHVDTIDLIDSPAVREALAGKDVLLQPGVPGSAVASKGQIDVRLHETPLLNKAGPLLDIDDIATPGLRGGGGVMPHAQTRSYHTSRVLEGPRKRTVAVKDATEEKTTAVENPSPATVKAKAKAKAKTAPVKPSYAGFSTHDLQKQISSYGFKPVKKRDKMIELLNQCWDDQHGGGAAMPEDGASETPADGMTHGDFLSKVHDVATRPVPKEKKTRAKRKSAGSSETIAMKEPKKRKKAEPKPKDTTKKVTKPRKRTTATTKKAALSEEKVMDVDDIDDVNDTTKTASDIAQAQKTATPKKPKPKSKSKADTSVKPKKPATPPPTLPKEISFDSSSPAPQISEDNAVRPVVVAGVSGLQDSDVSASAPAMAIAAGQGQTNASVAASPSTLTPQPTPLPLPDLKLQIRPAIEFQSTTEDGLTPTWREKILMYDPIVLEDLTVWLNTCGFRAVQEDREISALEVRAWCEENGVCCLWKGGWRGRRKGDGD